MTTQQLSLKTRSLTLVFAILLFAAIALLQKEYRLYSGQNHANVLLEQQQAMPPIEEIACDEIMDDLSILLDQPIEQEDSCLFVGCNALF